jgi:hypothetical protein
MTSDVKVDNDDGSLLISLPVGRNVDDCAFEGRNNRLTLRPLRSIPDEIDPLIRVYAMGGEAKPVIMQYPTD